jgi:hypothetical protein
MGQTVDGEPRQLSLSSQTTFKQSAPTWKGQPDKQKTCKSQQIWTPTETQRESANLNKFEKRSENQVSEKLLTSVHYQLITCTKHHPKTTPAPTDFKLVISFNCHNILYFLNKIYIFNYIYMEHKETNFFFMRKRKKIFACRK